MDTCDVCSNSPCECCTLPECVCRKQGHDDDFLVANAERLASYLHHVPGSPGWSNKPHRYLYDATAIIRAQAKALRELRADRDEWYQQHENALACWYHERDYWQGKFSKISALLVNVQYLYNNYRVDSRGPSGLLLDILDLSNKDLAKVVRENGWEAAYDRCYEVK